MVDIALPYLDKTIPIVTVRQNSRGEWEGVPHTAYQRWWQNIKLTFELGSADAANKVTKVDYDIYIAPAISNPPTQSQVQTIANALAEVSQKLKV